MQWTSLIGGSLESPSWLFLAFCSKILGGGREPQMVLCQSMNGGSVVGTLKPYYIQKNLFELFALTGGGVAQNFRCEWSAQTWALMPRSHRCGSFRTFNRENFLIWCWEICLNNLLICGNFAILVNLFCTSFSHSVGMGLWTTMSFMMLNCDLCHSQCHSKSHL